MKGLLVSRNILTVTLIAFSLVVGAYPANAKTAEGQYDSMTESSTVTFEYIKQKAIKEGKVLDDNTYSKIMNNMYTARSAVEKEKSLDLLEDYVVYQKVTYLNYDKPLNSAAASPRPGDARLVESQYYGGNTEYAKPSGGLSTMAEKAIEFAIGQTHSYVGLFMSVLDIFIPEEEYTNYTGTITTLLHDHLYLQKTVEVYKNNGTTSGWEPMATSVKRNSSLQINTVYYKGKVRHSTGTKDFGLVQGQAGNFFYDNAKLISLAKSTASPLYYNYQGGSIAKVRPNFKY